MDERIKNYLQNKENCFGEDKNKSLPKSIGSKKNRLKCHQDNFKLREERLQ